MVELLREPVEVGMLAELDGLADPVIELPNCLEDPCDVDAVDKSLPASELLDLCLLVLILSNGY